MAKYHTFYLEAETIRKLEAIGRYANEQNQGKYRYGNGLNKSALVAKVIEKVYQSLPDRAKLPEIDLN